MIGRMAPAALGVVLLTTMAAAAEQTPAATMDARVARCVLDNIVLARTRAAADLVAEACRSLILQADGDGDNIALVKCVVPGDPQWVEFRLLTRTQCADAAGISGG